MVRREKPIYRFRRDTRVGIEIEIPGRKKEEFFVVVTKECGKKRETNKHIKVNMR